MKTPVPDARRRALCAVLALGGAPALRAEPSLPEVDLIVELRFVDALSTAGTTTAHTARIDSRGNTRSTGEVSTLGATQGASAPVQAVRVRNGAQARVQLVQMQSLVGAVAAWSGRSNGGTLTTAWAEGVDGFEVRPSWPGGRAPATVAVGATRTLSASASNVPPPGLSLVTTVQAPLGEWVDVAQVQRTGSAAVAPAGSTVGTQRALRLQLRVGGVD